MKRRESSRGGGSVNESVAPTAFQDEMCRIKAEIRWKTKVTETGFVNCRKCTGLVALLGWHLFGMRGGSLPPQNQSVAICEIRISRSTFIISIKIVFISSYQDTLILYLRCRRLFVSFSQVSFLSANAGQD
jgi:hypothetical protein